MFNESSKYALLKEKTQKSSTPGNPDLNLKKSDSALSTEKKFTSIEIGNVCIPVDTRTFDVFDLSYRLHLSTELHPLLISRPEIFHSANSAKTITSYVLNFSILVIKNAQFLA